MFSVNTDKGLNKIGGYLIGFGKYERPQDQDKNIFDFDIKQYDFSNSRMGAYILKQGGLEFDQNKYDQIIADEEEEARKPTEAQKLEAQVLYTAVCTDTLLESETE